MLFTIVQVLSRACGLMISLVSLSCFSPLYVRFEEGECGIVSLNLVQRFLGLFVGELSKGR